MLVEIFLAIFLGIVAGCITGLLPGIHINLVALSLVASSAFFLQYFSVVSLVVFLIAMSITHTFLDMVPSIFLGAPESDTALSVLPGHEMLLRGRGYEAVKLTAIGSFFALFLILLIAPIYIFFLPSVYPYFQQYMAHILIAFSAFLILRDSQKLWALFLFLASGVLGLVTFNLTTLREPLFPLLSGLFGISFLTASLFRKTKIPRQKIVGGKMRFKDIAKPLASSVISGSLVSFLPGLGAAQGAVIGSQVSGKLNRKGFLVLLGAISTVTMGLGFVALYAISRPRHGVAVAVGKLLETFTLQHLFLFIAVMFFAGSIAFFLSLAFAKVFARKIMKINYQKLSLAVMAFIIAMTLFLSGWLGLLVLLSGTSIGLIASIKGIRHMHLMGCLLLPVILLFLL